MHDDAYGVRLERNERQSGTDCVTEPEPEGNRELQDGRRIDTCRRIHIPMPHHLIVSVALVLGDGEFSPDVQPFAGVFVDLAFADLDTDIIDQRTGRVVDPVDTGLGGIGLRNRGEIDLDIQGGQQVRIPGNQGGDTAAKIGVAVEVDRNGFHREGRVTTIDMFEVCELGVARQIGILTPSCHEL